MLDSYDKTRSILKSADNCLKQVDLIGAVYLLKYGIEESGGSNRFLEVRLEGILKAAGRYGLDIETLLEKKLKEDEKYLEEMVKI